MKENGYAIIFNRFSINFIILDNENKTQKNKVNFRRCAKVTMHEKAIYYVGSIKVFVKMKTVVRREKEEKDKRRK